MKYYAGIDLGGTFIKCGIVNSDGKLIVKDKIPTRSGRHYSEIIEDMAGLVKNLEKEAEVKIDAVGIGSPGTVDSESGVIVYSNNIQWENVPLAERIGDILGLPVFITNDANAAALGESYQGAGKNFKSIVLLTLGTGVGGGIILDGKLYEGGHSAGAELGHTVIRMKGLKCTCGRRGCLESYASATALIKQTKKAMWLNPESIMWKICNNSEENVSGKTVFDGMLLDDKTAKRVFKNYVEYLSEGVADICNIFRPDAVLLGGGVCAQGEILLEPIRKKVSSMVFGGMNGAPVEILKATLGNDAGIIGAARLAMCGNSRD